MKKTLYILRGLPGCLPGYTEVMTPDGWIRIDKYKAGTRILQWSSKTGEARFVVPNDYIVADCPSMLHIVSGRVDMTLTHNHRVPLYNWAGKFVVKQAARVAAHPSKHIVPTTWVPASSGIDMTDDQLRLWVAIAADGSYPKAGHKCEIQVHKARKVERITALLNALNIPFKHSVNERPDRSATAHRFYFQRPSHPKHFDWRLALCSQHQARVITDELRYWDGDYAEGKGESFSSSVRQDADIAQYLFHAAGRVARLVEKTIPADKVGVWNTPWRVYPVQDGSAKGNVMIRCDDCHTDVVKPEDGKCYCFSVESTFFIVRQNDNIFITGNCGKSTLAHTLAPLVVESDMFRYTADMEYVFDSDKNREVAEKALALTRFAIIGLGLPAVAVANCNAKINQMRPFIALGRALGYEVRVIEMYGFWGNPHNVPDEISRKMLHEWEKITPELEKELGIAAVVQHKA